MIYKELREFTCMVLLQVLLKVGYFHLHLAAIRLSRANYIIYFARCSLIAAVTPELIPRLNVTTGSAPVAPPFLQLSIHAFSDPTTGCNPRP